MILIVIELMETVACRSTVYDVICEMSDEPCEWA